MELQRENDRRVDPRPPEVRQHEAGVREVEGGPVERHRAHLTAGTTAIREGSRLERAFRDMYTGTQHAFIGEKVATDAAQIWLGIVEDQRGL